MKVGDGDLYEGGSGVGSGARSVSMLGPRNGSQGMNGEKSEVSELAKKSKLKR